MSDWPSGLIAPPTLHPASPEALGALAAVVVAGSATWPAASRAFVYPFTLSAPFPVTKLWWANGATVSGNVDCGIYSADETTPAKIASTGSTAQAGASAVQSVAASLLLTPGHYLMALVIDNATATVMRFNPNTSQGQVNMAGVAQQSTAFTLPASLTLVRAASAFIPFCGLCSVATI